MSKATSSGSLLSGPTLSTYVDLPDSFRGGAPRPAFELQYTIHDAIPTVRREFLSVFPDAASVIGAARTKGQLYAIVTMQRSDADLVDWSDVAAAEKDRLLENFYAWSHALRTRIQEEAQASGVSGRLWDRPWERVVSLCTAALTGLRLPTPLHRAVFADFVDPCSGTPAVTRACAAVYAEVESTNALVRYPTLTVGQCTVVAHPLWGTHVYPATFFAAGADLTLELITAALAALEGVEGKDAGQGGTAATSQAATAAAAARGEGTLDAAAPAPSTAAAPTAASPSSPEPS